MPRLITQTVIADFRDRLCEVAAELFAERGCDGFNMRELARRLRVSPMTAYRYFKGKNEILAALRARAFGHFADCLEQANASPTLQRSAALVQAYSDYVQLEEASYRLMFDLLQPQAHAVPELAVEERRARRAMTDYARLMVQDGMLDGDPEMIGRILWSALHGAASLHLTANLPELGGVLSETVRIFTIAYRGDGATAQIEWPVRQPHEPHMTTPTYTGLIAIPAAE